MVQTLIELSTALDEAHKLIPKDIGVMELQDRNQSWNKIINPLNRGVTKLINNLSKPEKEELLALMWAGRDCSTDSDFPKDGSIFKSYLDTIHRQVDQHTGHYLNEKPLARYLTFGLEHVGLAFV